MAARVLSLRPAAFEPSNLVPGIGPSPDKMMLGRMFSYPDAHRARIGANYNLLPVNAPKSPVHSYSKDGAMRFRNVSDPVYAPNSKGGPKADTVHYGEPAGWYTDGEMVHAAQTLHAEDDDWGQAGTMVRDVLTMPPARGWEQHRRPPARWRDRARTPACLRVLAQRGQGPGRSGRAGRPRRTALTAPV
jgi:hypothetical protein